MENESSVTRKRAKNFSADEEVLLVQLVETHKNIIENKKSDAVIWKQKETTWSQIEKEFAATTGVSRPWKTLRDKFDVIKRRCKSEMAAVKADTYRTGGGVASSKMSTVSTKVAAMLGDSATGLQNCFDSDSITENNNKSPTDLESHILSNETQNANSEFITEEQGGCKSDWSTWNPSALKRPKAKELAGGVKKKRNVEAEKLELIMAQTQFYRDENARAQEKHQLEIASLKLKHEILLLELEKGKHYEFGEVC